MPIGQLGWHTPVLIPITPPVMVATAAMRTPSLIVAIAMQPPAMHATALILTPTISMSTLVQVPLMQAAAQMLAPTILVGTSNIVTAPLMPAAAAMLTPAIGKGVGITAPLLAATAAMPIPTVAATSTPPVTFKGATSVLSSSLTLPTHAVGDIIVIYAWDSITTTVPTKPTASGTVPNWNIIYNTVGATAIVVAYFVATAANHTSGSWTNSSEMAAAVLSGQGSTPIGGLAVTYGSGGTATAPAVTMSQTDGTSALVQQYANSTTGTWSAAPAGYTHQVAAVNAPCINTKNAPSSDGAIAQTTSATGNNVAVQLEIRAH